MPWSLTREHRDFARNLRNNPTPPERALWALIRKQQTGAKFRRQAPIGPYVADFLSHELKLIIELDGHSHSGAEAQARDTRRDRFLKERGFEVLRIGNADVFRNPEGVWRMITDRIAASHAPSP